MANTFTSLNPEYWSNELQKTYFVENTAVFLAGSRGRDTLSANGRKFHIPIMSHVSDGTYTPGSDITDTDITSSDQELEVDTFKYGSAYIDDTEAKQSLYGAASKAAMSIMRTLNNRVEQAFLAKVTDASNSVDAGDVGGTSGSNIALTTSNILDVFTSAHTKLDTLDMPMASRVAVVGPHTVALMRKVKAQRETPLGDTVLANGLIGPWAGWTVVQNNNLPFTAVLGMATNVTANDTITVAGVTFTAKATPASAGEFDIGGTNDATGAIIANAINGSSTGKDSATGYFEVSSTNRFKLMKRGITASWSDANDQLTITGYGDITVSETLTASADVWSSHRQDSWFGIRGATDLVVQLPVKVEQTRVEKRFGTRVKALVGYGAKTFTDGADGLVRVKIDASAWV